MSSDDAQLKPGDHVEWKWGASHPDGYVAEVHTEKVTKESKGKPITRNGTKEDPAVFVKRGGHGSKNPVVKLAHELDKVDDEGEGSEEAAADEEAEEALA